jgi:tripartite-type tricarboxylate transporter receptor subunit TctC
MTLVRRGFLYLAAASVVAPALSSAAFGQAYPTRPVRIFVGFPAGSGADILARLVGQGLSDRLHQPFIVENRPGAATNVATEAVVRAPADGYTLLFVTSPNAVNATFYQNLDFNFIRDITPVAGVGRGPFVLVVNRSFPAATLADFIAYAKANPGKINMASSGNGTTSHMAAELMKMQAGIDLVHVPYRGEPPALIDLLAGQVQALFISLPASIEHIRAGRLRALAVTTSTRADALPDVPAFAELMPGYDASAWQGIGAPKGTPAEVVNGLSKTIGDILADPKIRTRFSEFGEAPLALSASAFGNFIARETDKWGKVVRTANLKADGS